MRYTVYKSYVFIHRHKKCHAKYRIFRWQPVPFTAVISHGSEKTAFSNSLYTDMNILDKNADNRDTIAEVLSFLYDEFKVENEMEHLVAAGDAKTYSHLQAIKSEYGSTIDWLIPFIGDWHVLKNLQPVLIKIYIDAGLKQLANVSGHKGETLKALSSCSHFKRTHRFLLKSWEALYFYMYEECLKANSDSQEVQTIMVNIIDIIRNIT